MPSKTLNSGRSVRKQMLLIDADPDSAERNLATLRAYDFGVQQPERDGPEALDLALREGTHHFVFINATASLDAVPELLKVVRKLPRSVGVVVSTDRPGTLFRSFPDLADGTLGLSPVQVVVQPHDPATLMIAVDGLVKKLRWRRATSELHAMAPGDSDNAWT